MGVKIWCTLSLCQNCMLVHANGECGELSAEEPESLSKLIGEDIALGAEGHCEDCTAEDRNEGCDCGDLGFCTTQCDGCGSYLHGDRYAAVIFRPA